MSAGSQTEEIMVKTLDGTTMQQIHAAFTEAFSDYAEPYNKSLQEMVHTIERRGYDPSISFGAFDGKALVSFTLNGAGSWNGELTAYDAGTGTIPAYRKQGLAARIFNESIPVLRQYGIRQYLLEVIKVNTKAFELYGKLGFEVTRDLDYYISAKDEIHIPQQKVTNAYYITEIKTPHWKLFRTFWEFEPSWQNSVDSIVRKKDACTTLGIFDGDKLAGYGIVEKETGDIPQLAIADKYRRKGLATTLLQQLLQHTNENAVKLINADASYEPFRHFMQRIGIKPGYGQYEMIRKL